MGQKTVISSMSNAQVKNLNLLQRKAKEREAQGVFIIEGIKMFEEARADNLLKKTYVCESLFRELISNQPDYFDGLDYEIVTDAVFKEVSETKTPQGIMGMVNVAHYSLERILSDPNACLLLLEDIRDPGNLGTMLRTAEGAGVTGIILSDSSVDIYNPKVVRATMGSIYRVPFYQAKDFYEVLAQVKVWGIEIYAAHLQGIPYDTEGSFQKRCALLIGNEANGLTKEASDLADTLIKIPMEGRVESLNAAVAAAILMYETARQRRR